MNISTTLGDRVASLRKEKGLKQKELADRAEISTPFVSDIENDKRNVSSKVLLRIAKALGTSLDYLMTGEGDQPKKPQRREIPSELETAAEEGGWTLSDTVALLEAKQMVLAKRGGEGEEKRDVDDLSRKDWKKLYATLIEN